MYLLLSGVFEIGRNRCTKDGKSRAHVLVTLKFIISPSPKSTESITKMQVKAVGVVSTKSAKEEVLLSTVSFKLEVLKSTLSTKSFKLERVRVW